MMIYDLSDHAAPKGLHDEFIMNRNSSVPLLPYDESDLDPDRPQKPSP